MLGHSSGTATTPAVYPTFPPRDFFKFFPEPDPQVLHPPAADYSFARPFQIDPDLYNNSLSFAVPATIAVVYATTVTILNQVNRRRGHKPWVVSKTLPFLIFVVTHNVFLALYSAWTCWGMVRAIRQSWPGWTGESNLVAVIDTLCKINGPRGLGSAATFDRQTGSWGVTDKTIRLLEGSPDPTDVGRIWNEGLAFYGWLFYISKFYEVVDTLIILAKGKRSSLLQTYHHAGAMICMWAGIRYMSPPIWMFVLINSGLHAYMYTYYTFTALQFRIPARIKKTLTALQIVQIVFGISYAAAHLFVAYDIPISVPYVFLHKISSAIPAAASSASSAVASATATANLGSWLKKAALRAAGEEGLAENVRNRQGKTFGIDATHAADVIRTQEEIRYRTEYNTINCLDTSGQTFAILLNALYLGPLAYLFLRFFFQTYILRVRATTPPVDHKKIAKQSGKEAADKVQQKIQESLGGEQGSEKGEYTEKPHLAEDLSSAAKDAGTGEPSDVFKPEQKRDQSFKNISEDVGSKASDAVRKANGTVGDKLKATKNEIQENSVEVKNKKNEEDTKERQRQPEKSEGDDEKKSDPSQSQQTEAHPWRRAEYDDEGEPQERADDLMSEPEEISHSRLYEVNADEILDESEKKAEQELSQPNGAHDKVNDDDKENDEDDNDEGNPAAYEANPDRNLDEDEKEAEKETQPNGPVDLLA